jgi:hypothetical protein
MNLKLSVLSRGLAVVTLLGLTAAANAQLNINYKTGNAGLFVDPTIAGDSAMITGGIFSATLMPNVSQILPLAELDYSHNSMMTGSVTFDADRQIMVNGVSGMMSQDLTIASAGVVLGIAAVNGGNAVPALTLDLGSGNLLDIVPVAGDSGFVMFGGSVKTSLSATFTLRQSPANVPEPGSIALLVGAGIGGLMIRRRRRK